MLLLPRTLQERRGKAKNILFRETVIETKEPILNLKKTFICLSNTLFPFPHVRSVDTSMRYCVFHPQLIAGGRILWHEFYLQIASFQSVNQPILTGSHQVQHWF